MVDVLLDGIIDSIKIFPYLLIGFIILEYLEKKINHKNEKILMKYNKFGPLVGGVLGGLPQCGFSTMGASLFSNNVITMGCIIAIFLATSDEMLLIMISEKINISFIISIIIFKVIIGIMVGFFVDLLYKRKNSHISIHEECIEEHCNCKNDGIFLSGLKHSLKIILFILIMNTIINILLYFIGEDTLKSILYNKNIFTYFLSSLIGLIPNCCSSVIITELFLGKFISLGVMLSGLLTGSGIGILVLFRSNKSIKENISILSIIYFVGVLVGILVDIFI